MNLFIDLQMSAERSARIRPNEAGSLHRRNFEELFLEAVDEQLTLLGDSPKQALYSHLEKGFSIKTQEIPRRSEAFADAMEKIFGQGANYLEVLIVKRLHSRIGLDVNLGTSDLTFTEHIESAKRHYIEDRPADKQETDQCQLIKAKC